MFTKKNSRQSDAFELLSPVVSDDYVSPAQHRPKSSGIVTSLKFWFKSTILLSGSGYVQVNPIRTGRSLRYGWRFSAIMSCIIVGLCLCINTTFTLYVLHINPQQQNGIGDFASGDCDKVLSNASMIHIAINVLATILVAASNYNMQCLCAPTRSEVDKIHQRGVGLEIGAQSLRNLRLVRKWKVALWLALLLSTWPLHALWNSAVFSVTTINEYAVLVVSSDFLNVDDIYGGMDCSDAAMVEYQEMDSQKYVSCWLLSQAKANNLTRLEPAECISHYADKLETTGYDLIAVAKESSLIVNSTSAFGAAKVSYPVMAYFESMSFSTQLESWCKGRCLDWCRDWDCTTYCNDPGFNSSTVSPTCYQWAVNGTSWDPGDFTGPSDWTCDPDYLYLNGCSVKAATANSTDWKILPQHYEIDHCLVSQASFTCKLQYSPIILYTVIACNAVKFLAILLHLMLAREPIFATFGDAVSSFMARPDGSTVGNCLYTTHDSIADYYRRPSQWAGDPSRMKPRIWKEDVKGAQRWAQGASWRQFILCAALWILCIIVGSNFLTQGIQNTGRSIAKSGFGSMNVNAIVSTSSYQGGSGASILATSLVVNTPQLILSSLYFMYNSTYTRMASAYEWSLYGTLRKALRVTNPTGAQRSSYWLQLPWKFSLPLIISSAVLHWLVSQSIFLINVRVQMPTNQLLHGNDTYLPMASDDGTITAAGYSPLAIVYAIVLGTLMLVALLGVSLFKLKGGIPLAGSNSYAISAACHPPSNDTNAATAPVLWGVVKHQEGLSPGHCSFSSLEVTEPIVGDFYAGLELDEADAPAIRTAIETSGN